MNDIRPQLLREFVDEHFDLLESWLEDNNEKTRADDIYKWLDAQRQDAEVEVEAA
jgi:hypothetical protein